MVLKKENNVFITAGSVIILISMLLIFFLLGTLFLFALFLLGCVLLLAGLLQSRSNIIYCHKCGNPMCLDENKNLICNVCDIDSEKVDSKVKK
jgi:hypothetical protein